MNILITTSEPQHTAQATPEFPIVRYDSGLSVYQEALIQGQYFGVHWSAMGRPETRQNIWNTGTRSCEIGEARAFLTPLIAQHAFMLEIDGQLLADHWEWVDGGEATSPLENCREGVVKLRHTVRPIEVEIHTRLDGSPILVRWLVIHNRGDKPAAIAMVDPWSGRLFGHTDGFDQPIQVEPGFLAGRYRGIETLDEGEFAFEPIPLGGMFMESRLGSSGFRSPYFAAKSQTTGETFFGALAYPGNWRLELRYEDTLRRFGDYRTQSLHFRFGLCGPAPIYVLGAGETVATPAVHLGKMFGDLDACVNAWHDHLQRSVIPPQPAGLCHLIEYNHGGNTINAQIKEAGLLSEVEIAAALGAELFTIDAGWFGQSSVRWTQGAGDWEAHELLPRGLEPVFDAVRAQGMRCGLWYEIERAGPKSKLAANHPDWLMKRNGQVIHQLDLSKPEVAKWVEQRVVSEIEKYKLDCFRLDYNIRIGDGSQAVRDGFVESSMWRYYDNLGRIFDQLRKRFPHVLFQNCASGGCRNDLGMMSRFHYSQLSDNLSPCPALKIINGATMFLRPDQIIHFIGAFTKGASDLEFSLRTGLFTHLVLSGLFPSMSEQNEAQADRCRYYVDLYKRFVRPMLAQVRVFHHTPFQSRLEAGHWIVLEYAMPDGSRGYAGVWRLLGEGTDEFHFIPRGLRRDKQYKVTFGNAQEIVKMSGDRLMNEGLHLRVAGRLTSELLLFEATERLAGGAGGLGN